MKRLTWIGIAFFLLVSAVAMAGSSAENSPFVSWDDEVHQNLARKMSEMNKNCLSWWAGMSEWIEC
jgi:hypothetical protein